MILTGFHWIRMCSLTSHSPALTIGVFIVVSIWPGKWRNQENVRISILSLLSQFFNDFKYKHCSNCFFSIDWFPLFSIIRFANGPCTGPAGQQGVCYTLRDCLRRRGSAFSSCAAGYGVCCSRVYTSLRYSINVHHPSNFLSRNNSVFYIVPARSVYKLWRHCGDKQRLLRQPFLPGNREPSRELHLHSDSQQTTECLPGNTDSMTAFGMSGRMTRHYWNSNG